MKLKYRDGFESVGALAEFIGMPEADLVRLAHSQDAYRGFDLKNLKGRWRHIDRPIPQLRDVQDKLNATLTHNIEFPSYIIGGVPGRSHLDHAWPHLGKPLIITLDLKDYFPSIGKGSVYTGLHEVLGLSRSVANILTLLTTCDGYVPQGSPTSLTVANIASFRMFAKMYEHAKEACVLSTFYVDDIAMSGKPREMSSDQCALSPDHTSISSAGRSNTS